LPGREQAEEQQAEMQKQTATCIGGNSALHCRDQVKEGPTNQHLNRYSLLTHLVNK
jgi:hypothetical protein